MRLLALGDSYTIGEGVAPGQRWPEQLSRRLRAGGVPLDPPAVIARTGWTADELEAAIDAASLSSPYDAVSLLIGVNDQYRGRTTVEFHRGFERLLTRAITFGGARPERVVAISIPDWGVTPFARHEGRDAEDVANTIDRFNATAWDIAGAAGVPFVDVTSISRTCGGGPGMLAGDGLHPGPAQYALWADRLLPAFRCILVPSTRTG